MTKVLFYKKLKSLFFLAFLLLSYLNASTLNLSISSNPSRINPILSTDSASNEFKNNKIRQALNLTINRQELIDILYFGHAKICTGPFLPNTFAFNSNVKAPIPNSITVVNKEIKNVSEALIGVTHN